MILAAAEDAYMQDASDEQPDPAIYSSHFAPGHFGPHQILPYH